MEPKDDGKRTEYASGALRSDRTGRGRYDLISPHGLKRLAVQYEHGAAQKGERNWEQGFPISRAICSAIGHLYDYLAGDRSEDHLAAVAWQMFAAMHFEELIKQYKLPKKLNDVPKIKCGYETLLGSKIPIVGAVDPGGKISFFPGGKEIFHKKEDEDVT